MIYSCKKYVELDDLGNRKTICFYVNPVTPAKPEGEAEVTEWEKQIAKIEELRSQCIYLGAVAGRSYYYVPDELELQAQEPELDVQAHNSLDAETENELKISGLFASMQRYDQTVKSFPDDVRTYSEINLVALGSQIRDVASVLYAMFDKSYITLDEKQTDLTAALATLKKLSASSTVVQDELDKVGL